jgi:epoxyqueuosine reductase
VSYLTIENKGPIPLELRPLIGHRIYGCDTCLDVCPWNRFAQASSEARFAAREFVGMPLREYLALDDDAFRALFRKSPIKRIKRPRFLRNVCVALGNTGTLDDLAVLDATALDPDPLIAEHAAWAAGEIRRRIL